MRILSMGDRIRPGHYAVRARFARSVLLMNAARRVVFIVDKSIGPGPLNLVVADPAAFAQGTALVIPRRPAAPRFDSRQPPGDPALLRPVLARWLPRHAPPDSLVSLFQAGSPASRLQQLRDARFREAFHHLAAGHLATGVRRIRGCGAGLTPSGDDFLCGWLLACRLQRKFAQAHRILKHARGRNPVSNAFLELAAQGRVHLALQQLLHNPTAARVRAVCAFGHCSGADLLCGMLFGLGYSEFRIQNSEDPARPARRAVPTPSEPASTRRRGPGRCGTNRRLRGCGAR